MLAGRNLTLADFGKQPERIVVNRAFADFFFPLENAVGKAMVQGVDGTKPPTAIIVGIVGTARFRSFREVDAPIYYGVSDDASAGETMYVRTRGNPAQMIDTVRAEIRRLDPQLPIIEVSTLEQEVQNSLWQERLVTILAGFFGIVALALSALGLYAALAYSVARRTREVGIRMALGAQQADIVEAVCGRITISVAIGAGFGVLAAAGVLRAAKSLFFGVDALDPVSLGVAALALIVCSIAAAAFPSWRAARTDSARALREE